jgi:hypothetical protein
MPALSRFAEEGKALRQRLPFSLLGECARNGRGGRSMRGKNLKLVYAMPETRER